MLTAISGLVSSYSRVRRSLARDVHSPAEPASVAGRVFVRPRFLGYFLALPAFKRGEEITWTATVRGSRRAPGFGPGQALRALLIMREAFGTTRKFFVLRRPHGGRLEEPARAKAGDAPRCFTRPFSSPTPSSGSNTGDGAKRSIGKRASVKQAGPPQQPGQ
jgi:hypothetical protein